MAEAGDPVAAVQPLAALPPAPRLEMELLVLLVRRVVVVASIAPLPAP
jgi:hypothetical protein